MSAFAVAFAAPERGGTRQLVGYRTTTVGLVVFEARDCEFQPRERVYRVAHVRSGLRFPFCLESAEAALAFANSARRFGDWQLTGTPLARRIALPYVRRQLIDQALAVGGHEHEAHGDRVGEVHSVDNGLIA
ncbi:hypothetical protein BTM25_40940 [Actinomadura rubteroloni]|uniref:Uncharacterized protein n=1 Tax=Actinomadura rubteroloni TaxID=1926885 RepID=A0A2P4UK64_9ACTN|nr:hypothetical protein [Actinomadura rubteroloni]POM25447.1 hypothetical protein BTM25_40940 [Actinomadura rubteroloni]